MSGCTSENVLTPVEGNQRSGWIVPQGRPQQASRDAPTSTGGVQLYGGAFRQEAAQGRGDHHRGGGRGSGPVRVPGSGRHGGRPRQTVRRRRHLRARRGRRRQRHRQLAVLHRPAAAQEPRPGTHHRHPGRPGPGRGGHPRDRPRRLQEGRGAARGQAELQPALATPRRHRQGGVRPARGGRVDADGTTVSPIIGPQLDGNGFALIKDTDNGVTTATAATTTPSAPCSSSRPPGRGPAATATATARRTPTTSTTPPSPPATTCAATAGTCPPRPT
ncbi:hypothetical protein SFUMM280S_10874 [Streptomyces fumanus]